MKVKKCFLKVFAVSVTEFAELLRYIFVICFTK